MKAVMTGATLVAMAGLMAACVPMGDGGGAEDPTTAEFRQALVSEEDVASSYGASDGAGTTRQALGAEHSHIAKMTAETVVGTNEFLRGHFQMMRSITSLPPTLAEEDRHEWEGDHEGVHLRLVVERSEAPRGTRFDYRFEGYRLGGDPQADYQSILDGHVVRIETRPEEWGKQGFGVVRFYFGTLAGLLPNKHGGVDGKARVAFRRVGAVRQVRTRLIDVVTPHDPNFPPRAAFEYTLLPENAGALRWFSRSDIKGDGAPLELAAVHSAWRADRSGAGRGFVTGGSLEVDFWQLGECWDVNGLMVFRHLSTPDAEARKGDLGGCFRQPDQLEEPPVIDDNLPDEDPAIPEAHPAE